MDLELLKWIAPLIVGPLSAFGGWYFGRQQRAATTAGLELDNEAKVHDLYTSMVEIAEGAQQRSEWALSEHESMRRQLNECVEAREQAERRDGVLEQQRKIEKAAADLAIAKLNHRIAELEMKVRQATSVSVNQPLIIVEPQKDDG